MLPDLFRLIGSDRYLTAEEVERAAEPHSLTAAAWEVYATHFDRFSGATLDPQFHRLVHPATQTGRVRLGDDTTVLIVGTSATPLRQLEAVAKGREHFRIFTSPRGAGLLRQHGLVPDLVVVEDHVHPAMAQCPRVAADWRTPRAALTGIAAEALFVPSPALTWGLWPATAVAMAADAKASRIALLGVDTEHAPLRALLELIARLAPFTALDCSEAGTPRGWVKATLQESAGAVQHGILDMNLWRAPTQADRVEQLRSDLAELGPVLGRACQFMASTRALDSCVEEAFSWREQPRLRVLLQESLGVSLLPRLWRLGPQQTAGRSRRVRLAMSEIVGQADALVRSTRAA
jgi:hypothetical protein